MTTKSNGVQNASTNGSSAFISSSTANISTDDHDDGSLVIGSSTLPATVPLAVESTQIINDDQVEIVSTVRTKQIIEEIDENTVRIETTTTSMTTTTEVEIENTQSYELELPGEIKHSNGLLAETQPYEMESEAVVTDVVETKQEEIHKVVIDNEEMTEKVTTTITTTTKTIVIEENEGNPPMQTLAYDLQAAPTVVESMIGNGFTQVYDIDEQIEIKAKSPSKTEENVTEIQIIKTTTKNLSNEIPETQLNDEMEMAETQINDQMESAPTLVNDEKLGETETQVNDQMEPIQTLVNDDLPAETQVNDQMESAQTLANDDDLLADTQVNDQMDVEQIGKLFSHSDDPFNLI